MSQIVIDKDIYLRDSFGVKRREWVAGQVVQSYVYYAVLKTNTVVNPEDLPVEYTTEKAASSVNTPMAKVMETKVLPEVVEETKYTDEVEVEKPKSKNKKKGKNNK